MPSQQQHTVSGVDPRHQHRIKLMQRLFAATFDEEIEQMKSEDATDEIEVQAQVNKIIKDLDQIDPALQEHAPERPLSEINQVDLAILRLIVWEAQNKETPHKVLIDEAVELAKEFGSESSPRFVNGVLGKLLMDN